MFCIEISFSKNRDNLPLAGTLGTGSKNRDCPGKIGTLGADPVGLGVCVVCVCGEGEGSGSQDPAFEETPNLI